MYTRPHGMALPARHIAMSHLSRPERQQVDTGAHRQCHQRPRQRVWGRRSDQQSKDLGGACVEA
jgi:hypothetical protein